LDFLKINEIEIPIDPRSVEPELIHSHDRADGFVQNRRIVLGPKAKREWNLITGLLDPYQAYSLIGIINGGGDYWSFNDIYTSGKGERAVLEPREEDPSDHIFLDGVFDRALRLGDYDLTLPVWLPMMYTIQFWRRLIAFDDRWYHIVIDSGGAQYVDGEYDEEFDTSWVEAYPEDNEVVFEGGDENTGDIDEFFVVPEALADINTAQSWYTLEDPIAPPPDLRVAGSILDDDESEIICRGEIEDMEYAPTGRDMLLAFRLREV